MKFSALFSVIILSAMVMGCDHSQSGLPVVTMQIGKQTFQIEVAKKTADQETGLMKRDSMPADHGMIFIFPDMEVRNFWMKNTRIPLDIIFLDSAGKVVSIRQMEPFDRTETSSNAPARYAIEINQGRAEKAGLKIGDSIILPAAVTSDSVP